MSLDTHAQIRATITREIRDWAVWFSIDISMEEVKDLASGLHTELREGCVFDQGIRETNDTDDEHYN